MEEKSRGIPHLLQEARLMRNHGRTGSDELNNAYPYPDQAIVHLPGL